MSEALTKFTTEVVSAYVSKNHVRPEELASLIKDVHGKLAELSAGKSEPPIQAKPEPLMPIKKTITPGYLVSLEDGKHYKTLRRHLTTRGLTPDEYRAKWGLPIDYPMVAKDYAERRSALAKSIGLGRKASNSDPSDPVQAIADDLVEVIAEDVIGVDVGVKEPPSTEGTVPIHKTAPKKAGRKVTPHPKPKDRVEAEHSPESDQKPKASKPQKRSRKTKAEAA